MKIGVIGLGSMGKRRIRNLIQLGFEDVVGFDLRQDRVEEVRNLYAVSISSSWEDFCGKGRYDCIVISVPPAVHNQYIQWCVDSHTPCFVEASVILDGLSSLHQLSLDRGVLIAPSCTLRFHPAVKCIRDWVLSGKAGKISNVIHISGQYLPDWHVYEAVSDYYVSAKETGGAREIVPFELTWLLEILGWPSSVFGMHGKTIEIAGAPGIDDTYNIVMQFESSFLSLTVDVVSRKATRRFLLNGSLGQIIWNWDEHRVCFYGPHEYSEFFDYEAKAAHSGYNKNITEEMYEEEMRAFISAVNGDNSFPNNLSEDIRILEILEASEQSFQTKKLLDLRS
jgi:predicted dehydrogenase